MKVVIIGGVAGGASAAARLRRLDENAEIVMLERGEYISFANCGLPYYIGGEIEDKADLELQTPDDFRARFNIDARTLSEAIEIDRAAKLVCINDMRTGEKYYESYDKLILSPGARPVVPPIEGARLPGVFTLRTIPDAVAIRDYIVNEAPSSAVVIGGGNIGVEVAENLSKSGVGVTIVEMSDHLITSLDYDMACLVHNYMRSQGLSIILSNGVKRISRQNDALSLELQSGTLTTDMIIMSVGVSPDTGLAVESGLAVTKRGAIIVDDNMRTSDENIYAVGDAVEVTEFVTRQSGYIALAGPANKQGRIAADNICGIDKSYKGTQGSSIMKVFDMTVAVTGISEAVAISKNISYEKVFTLSASHAGYYPGGTELSIKTVFEASSGRILGAQIVGYEGVDKRCDVIATAIRSGMTIFDLAELELCYSPPYSSAKDPVNFAGFVAENVLSGKIKQYHWHDVGSLPRDGSVTLLDVRTPREYAAGHIDGFMNIELDTLRDCLTQLDNQKRIYVNCRSGQRSYIACRILTQNGFDCLNLSGGYWLYSSIIN